MSDDLNGAIADLERAEAEIDTLRAALLESLILQSHYAIILNRFDGGERMTFPTTTSWLERLRMIGKLPKDKS